MSWKSTVITGLLCLIVSPVLAQPTLRVTSLDDLTTTVGENRQWLVEILPDGAELPGSLAVELAVTHSAGSSVQPTGIVNGDADNTNAGVNDTWYYNETAAGSGTLLWNISDAPADPTDLEQNVGDNPFTGGPTEGLYINGSNLFAALGSTIFAGGTADVDVLHIVTNGRGGILSFGDGILAQNGDNFNLAAINFYVPGDFSGDGIVGSGDFDLLLEYFGKPVNTGPGEWDGRAPFNGATGSSADFDRLLANFGSGTASGGSGGIAGGSVGVPEPGSIFLLTIGALLAAVAGRRTHR